LRGLLPPEGGERKKKKDGRVKKNKEHDRKGGSFERGIPLDQGGRRNGDHWLEKKGKVAQRFWKKDYLIPSTRKATYFIPENKASTLK